MFDRDDALENNEENFDEEHNESEHNENSQRKNRQDPLIPDDTLQRTNRA